MDVIEIDDDGHRVLMSHFMNDDGSWSRFMAANYRRMK
ncbi:MAG: DUF1579 family protein [Armatimonadetes bacterium]|nr:DUF1579 family protein [Armatimonadota bacterium]